jgi:hypothetical protein
MGGVGASPAEGDSAKAAETKSREKKTAERKCLVFMGNVLPELKPDL